MGKKKNKKGRTPAAALQYSKWMSKFICWVWALYRFGVLIAATFEPDASTALATTLANLDWIMLVNEGTYLINSLGEKYIFSDRFILRWVDKGGFKNMMGRIGLINKAIKTQDEQAEDEQLMDETINEELMAQLEEEEGGEEDGYDNNG